MRPRLPLPDPDRPPPGPFRPAFWRSPLRSPRLTAILGAILLVGLPLVAITGLLSNDAYQPGLGGNALGRNTHTPLDLYLFGWPTHPRWLYALTQGLHVTVGLIVFPIVLTKLWSVIPRLFEWPPVRSPAHALERLSLALLVGSALFEFVTGILNIQYWYAFPFDFVQAHYYGAWVFIGALVVHIPLKLPTMRRSLRTREALFAGTGPVASTGTGPLPLTSPNPGPVTISRRGLFTAIGATSLILGVQGLGQSLGGPLRSLAILLPRGQRRPGPLGFPVNRTWAGIGGRAAQIGDRYRLTVSGPRTLRFTRAQLEAMPQYEYALPIACVEGWSTTQRWSGVRIADLAALSGITGEATVTTVSLDRGTYGRATLGHEQVADPQTLLALRVNGLQLPLDHGYPARVIGPALPGVHCTKWVTGLRFEELA
jgi:DMSO/TMAO reductase YedYZ molybdopterin-dependent catalytic subunit